MNKRIRELAEQAIHIEEPDGLFPREVFDREKFAELIVQECASIVDQPYDFKTPPDQRTYRYPLSGDEVLKHFGVEQ